MGSLSGFMCGDMLTVVACGGKLSRTLSPVLLCDAVSIGVSVSIRSSSGYAGHTCSLLEEDTG